MPAIVKLVAELRKLATTPVKAYLPPLSFVALRVLMPVATGGGGGGGWTWIACENSDVSPNGAVSVRDAVAVMYWPAATASGNVESNDALPTESAATPTEPM